MSYSPSLEYCKHRIIANSPSMSGSTPRLTGLLVEVWRRLPGCGSPCVPVLNQIVPIEILTIPEVEIVNQNLDLGGTLDRISLKQSGLSFYYDSALLHLSKYMHHSAL